MIVVEDRWYTVEDIAEALKVHANTVRRWLRAGDLAGHNFGGKMGYRIRQQDFEAFLAERFEGHRPEQDDESEGGRD